MYQAASQNKGGYGSSDDATPIVKASRTQQKTKQMNRMKWTKKLSWEPNEANHHV